MTEGTVVVALARDLMDRSRFGVLSGSGVDVRFVASAAAIVEVLAPTEPFEPVEPLVGPEPLGPAKALGPAIEHLVTGVPSAIVVVDLSRPDALEAIDAGAAAGARVVAYGSHVDRDRLDAAHAAGAEVLARSAFFARLPDLLSS